MQPPPPPKGNFNLEMKKQQNFVPFEESERKKSKKKNAKLAFESDNEESKHGINMQNEEFEEEYK